MEHKAWLWRRKSSERTMVLSEKCEESLVEHGQEKEKASELERSLRDLDEQLSYARAESNSKDDLLAKQTKIVEEAIAGWEKAEAEAASFKQELDDALLQKSAVEERILNIDAALNECMQQLHVLKDEKQNDNDVALKMAREQQRVRMLEEKLAETNKMLAKIGSERNDLNRLLETKEKLIDDLREFKSKSEENFKAIVATLDSSEKNNASMRYEVCMLQKELEIRNEEREFNLKSADASHKQYLDSMKKIGKLETECQRLRIMVRKRLPGPAALSKMRSEVEILEKNSTEISRKTSNSTTERPKSKDFLLENSYDTSGRSVAPLIERLHAVEDENKILKETLSKKNGELKSLRVISARTASKLSLAEKQLEELSKGQTSLEMVRTPRSISASYDLTLESISEDAGNKDSISCTGSWASALISELEHFRTGKPTTPTSRVASSDLSFMSDFAEMEKLAIVCTDQPFGTSHMSSRGSPISTFSKGLELVPVDTPPYNASEAKNLIIDEVRDALSYSDPSVIKEFRERTQNNIDSSDLGKSVCRLIEIIEGIIHISVTNNDGEKMLSRNDGSDASYEKSKSLAGYVARAFLWESSEFSAVLQRFTLMCNDMLYGKADLSKFASELTLTLEWIINHCFSLQDVPSMKEMIKKQFNGDEWHSDDELEDRINRRDKETKEVGRTEELKFDRSLPLVTMPNGLCFLSSVEDSESKFRDENKRLKHDITTIESTKNDLEGRIESLSAKNEILITQLQESKESISNLQVEVETLKEIKGLIEDQIENQKLISEDLGSQLSLAKAELNESHQKFSTLEVELEDKSNCCDELEATCLELQLESVATKERAKHSTVQEEKQLRTGWEITAASQKLAECQETILNLGKQLKSLASPKDAALFDKVISTPGAATKIQHRSKLLDRMRAEDDEDGKSREDPKSPKTKETLYAEHQNPSAPTSQDSNAGMNKVVRPLSVKSPEQFNGLDRSKLQTDAGALALVPNRQKEGVGLLAKLLSRRKKESRKKSTTSRANEFGVGFP